MSAAHSINACDQKFHHLYYEKQEKKTNTNTYQGKEKEMTEVETASWIMLTAAKHKTTVGMGYL